MTAFPSENGVNSSKSRFNIHFWTVFCNGSQRIIEVYIQKHSQETSRNGSRADLLQIVLSIFGIAIVALPAGIITAGYMKELDIRTTFG